MHCNLSCVKCQWNHLTSWQREIKKKKSRTKYCDKSVFYRHITRWNVSQLTFYSDGKFKIFSSSATSRAHPVVGQQAYQKMWSWTHTQHTHNTHTTHTRTHARTHTHTHRYLYIYIIICYCINICKFTWLRDVINMSASRDRWKELKWLEIKSLFH